MPYPIVAKDINNKNSYIGRFKFNREFLLACFTYYRKLVKFTMKEF